MNLFKSNGKSVQAMSEGESLCVQAMFRRPILVLVVLCAMTFCFFCGVLFDISGRQQNVSLTEAENVALNKIMLDQKLAADLTMDELNVKVKKLQEEKWTLRQKLTQVEKEKEKLKKKKACVKEEENGLMHVFSYKPYSRKGNGHGDFKCRLDEWVMGVWEGREYVPRVRLYPKEGFSHIQDGRVITHQDLLKEKSNTELAAQFRYKMYSPEEARECVKGKRMVVIGDSYMRNMFIGLSDLISGNLSDTYDRVWRNHQIDPLQYNGTNLHMISPMYMSFWEHANEHIYFNLTLLRQADLIVAGILVHDIKKEVNERPELATWKIEDWIHLYESYLHRLVEVTKRYKLPLVWVTGPAYKKSQIPAQYQKYQNDERSMKFHVVAYQLMRKHNIPFVDLVHMTKSCTDPGCVGEGHHLSRYASRMKATIVMNYFCGCG
eukprot:Nk52_evm1s207 gene=Nk52_evmTU1s207